MLTGVGAEVREVRTPEQLDGLDGLVIPGGESTTMTIGIEREGLAEPLKRFAADGQPILATCAGLILLDRDHLGILDIRSERNAFGRQLHSFEADIEMLTITEYGGPLRAVFIRAPWVTEVGPSVRVLAEVDGHVVAVEKGKILAVSFHPEITGDDRLHQALTDLASQGFRGV